jgi:hypothetical protein
MKLRPPPRWCERSRACASTGCFPYERESYAGTALAWRALSTQAHMHDMLQFILDRHLPYAAVALDRHWNLLLSNRAASQFFPTLISPALSAPPNRLNVLRATFHPDGSRRWIVNWPEVERHLLRRVELDLGSAEDAVGAALLAEISSYASASSAADSHTALRPADLLPPIHIRTGDFDLRLFSTIMTLCRLHGVTLQVPAH